MLILVFVLLLMFPNQCVCVHVCVITHICGDFIHTVLTVFVGPKFYLF